MIALVLPNDTNTLSNLMGGRLMHWMDIVSAIAAQKHSNRIVVTASVDNISFRHPIRRGNVGTLVRRSTRIQHSMEAHDVDEEISGECETEYSAVLLCSVDNRDNRGDTRAEPENDERRLYEGALRRRQLDSS